MNKLTRHFFLLSLLFVSRLVLAASPDLQSGDLVFQTSQSAQSMVIQIASGSTFSHVGIVEVAPGGQQFVIEAISTVSRTPLSSWIARGKGGQYAVYRYEGIQPGQQQSLVSAAKKYLGRGYDIYFTSHNKEIYCSELVDYAARDIGLSIGQYQKLGELNVNNAQVMGLVQQRWHGHPLCRNVSSFEDCWNIILEDEMITPVSLTRDSHMSKIYSNYSWW